MAGVNSNSSPVPGQHPSLFCWVQITASCAYTMTAQDPAGTLDRDKLTIETTKFPVTVDFVQFAKKRLKKMKNTRYSIIKYNVHFSSPLINNV